MTATTREIYDVIQGVGEGDEVELETNRLAYKNPLTVQSVTAIEFENPKGDWVALDVTLEGAYGGEHHIHAIEDYAKPRDNGSIVLSLRPASVHERPRLDRFEDTTPCVTPLDDPDDEPDDGEVRGFQEYGNHTPSEVSIDLPDGTSTEDLVEAAREESVRSLADLANALNLPHTTKNRLRVAAVELNIYDSELDRPEANTTTDEHGTGVHEP